MHDELEARSSEVQRFGVSSLSDNSGMRCWDSGPSGAEAEGSGATAAQPTRGAIKQQRSQVSGCDARRRRGKARESARSQAKSV